MTTPEQQARDMLERMGVEDAQSWTAGEVAELAKLLNKPKWRRVEDALPTEGYPCFISRGRTGEDIGTYWGEYWQDAGGNFFFGVTHWRPVVFPDPPKG